MARRAKRSRRDSAEDMETNWPMIDSYTDKDGFLVKVYKAAYAVGMMPAIVRPRERQSLSSM